jgi:hypothetical protein
MRFQYLIDHLSSQVAPIIVAIMGVRMTGLTPIMTQAAQTSSTTAERDAGSWSTLVLESGDQFRLPAPPDESATSEELARLHAMVEERNDTTLSRLTIGTAAHLPTAGTKSP